MESMGEFDRESPMVKRFCQQMSAEDFEQQGLSYTQLALQELFSAMERQPELCEGVVRRRKQAELERGNGTTSLKAKFFNAVEGPLNRCNTVGFRELRDRVDHLQEEMQQVQTYAREARSAAKRSSRRLMAKQLDGMPTPRRGLGAPPLCCPPPPPPLPADAPLPGTMTPLRGNTGLQAMAATPDLLASYGLSRLNRSCSSAAQIESDTTEMSHPCLDIKTALLACDPVKRLKATGVTRSPGGTPTSQALIRGQGTSPVSAFNTALLSKFRNTQSPPQDPSVSGSPQSTDSETDSFATPPNTP